MERKEKRAEVILTIMGEVSLKMKYYQVSALEIIIQRKKKKGIF